MTFSSHLDTIQQQLIAFNFEEELRLLADDFSIEEIEFRPLNDFMEVLSSWGKQTDGAELSFEQVKELIKGGNIFANHKRGNYSILLLVDECLQRLTLLVNKDRSVPHFCFMTI